MDNQVPHISVSVEYNGEEIKQHCAHFIDAIHFLCKAEECIRNGLKIQSPVDVSTSVIQKENLKKLGVSNELLWAYKDYKGEVKHFASVDDLVASVLEDKTHQIDDIEAFKNELRAIKQYSTKKFFQVHPIVVTKLESDA